MSIEGDWQLVVASPMGKQRFTLTFREGDGVLTGTLVNNDNHLTTDIYDASVSGDALEWKATLKQMKMTLAFSTTVSGDTMAGKVKAGPFGKFKVSGERQQQSG